MGRAMKPEFHVSIWKLIDNFQIHDAEAGRFILLSPDGEVEVCASVQPWPSEEMARSYALARGWTVVPPDTDKASPFILEKSRGAASTVTGLAREETSGTKLIQPERQRIR
ncbi:hypothetical protein [Bauldia litoralis]|uniref:hypothetical protein n=1 Tax=Bauldia litoralis TaxID=665467 RepID=UPI00111462DE|nr:hypothetical protein [Bauldia litoralis]